MKLKTILFLLPFFTLILTSSIYCKNQFVTENYENVQLKGAGILPYAMGDDGKVYVLLARQSISKTPSSGLWKGFGGKRDPKETLVQTAIRTSKDEMRAVFGSACPLYNLKKFPFDQTIGTEHYHFQYLQLMAPVIYDCTIPEQFCNLTTNKDKLEVRWVLFEDLYETIQEAHKTAVIQNCYPSEIDRIMHVASAGDFLPLARDFIESLVANYRNPADSIHDLAQNIMPVPASLSTDKIKWTTTL